MATYRKRGKRWRAEIRRGDISLSQTFDSKGEAQAWAAIAERDIVARSRGTVSAGHTLKEALQKYAKDVSPTHRGARWEKIRLLAFEELIPFHSRAIDRIQAPDIADWRNERLKSVSPSTVKRELGLLSAVFEIAKSEWHWTAINPVKEVKKPQEAAHRTRTVMPDEWRALMRAVGWFPGRRPQSGTAWAVAAFCLATRTAMRAGEVLSLKSVDLNRRVAHLPTTKSGKPRDVPLSRQAVRILEGVTLPIPLSSALLDALFRRARRLALIDGLHFHDSRHTATTMLARKLDVMDLARVTGHSDLKMLLRYYNPSVDSLADRLR